MTNAEMYKTVDERVQEHEKFCVQLEDECPFVERGTFAKCLYCAFCWLEWEARGEFLAHVLPEATKEGVKDGNDC